MKTKRKPKHTEAEARRFFKTMRKAKESERSTGVRIYSDALLRVTVVVELDGVLWLVPKTANGWQRRQRLNMTPEVRTERLTPARLIDAAWLGIEASVTRG